MHEAAGLRFKYSLGEREGGVTVFEDVRLDGESLRLKSSQLESVFSQDDL